MRSQPPSPERPNDRPDGPSHGPHTLRVWQGVVVGRHGDDVFVQLGPRMQGVISARAFEEEPREGDVHRFTLRGKEESLWALSLAEERSLASWRDMEPGAVVQARVLRAVDGGLQLKIGPLHAFLPRSQTGLPRGKKPDLLLGKTLTVEVLEVDPERQRVIVSRRVVQKREKEGHTAGGIQPGQVVRGRVTRIEGYGAFVDFGRGREGLIHVSDLSHERVEHPGDVLALGDHVEVKVLYLRRGGRRIGLGLKQMQESPWRALERESYEGQVIEALVTRTAPFGVFVALRRGVEALLPNAETGNGRPARALLPKGRSVAVRLVELDVEAERARVSLLHSDGSPIDPEEARGSGDLAAFRAERADQSDGALGTRLGPLLRRALGGDAAAG